MGLFMDVEHRRLAYADKLSAMKPAEKPMSKMIFDDKTYIGTFVGTKAEGKISYLNGTFIQGKIKDEEFDGPGKMTLLIGDAIHEFKGTFTKGYLEGEVAHIKPDGTIIKENWSYVSSLEANQPIRLIATLL
jgi:hypothetical protein